MDYSLITKILNGKANDTEKQLFFAECDTNPVLKDEYLRLRNLWAISANETTPDIEDKFEHLWNKLQHSEKSRTRKIYFNIIKYAAVVILAIGFTFWGSRYFFTSNVSGIQSFASDVGSVSSVLLKDGSKIWLNSGSRLDIVENSKNKVVSKLSGEAYFNINHNDNREFIVELGEIRIRDVGTEFNIKAYEQDDEITASLINGKINVENISGKTLVSIKPETKFRYLKKNNQYFTEKENPGIVGGWKDGKFVFISMNLREICDELEKWYDVDILIKNKHIENEIYTSVLRRSTTIKSMLEMLKLIAGINYEINEKSGGKTIIVIK